MVLICKFCSFYIAVVMAFLYDLEVRDIMDRMHLETLAHPFHKSTNALGNYILFAYPATVLYLFNAISVFGDRLPLPKNIFVPLSRFQANEAWAAARLQNGEILFYSFCKTFTIVYIHCLL